MSPVSSAYFFVLAGFPRVSGDEPANFWYILDDAVFSPRERG